MARIKTDRVDSAHVKSKISEDLLNGIKPPIGLVLRNQDKKYWEVITQARLEWTDIDLVHAYNLSRILSDIQELQHEIDNTGYTIMGPSKVLIPHPNVKIIETLMARAQSLSVKIQVHAAATIGEVENNKKKNAAKQRAAKAIIQDEEDYLIAKPVH